MTTKILFICHGNICRSPMAEFVLKDLAAKQHLDYEIASCATSREEIGNHVYPPVQRLLASIGIDATKKTARQLTKQDFDYYDYLIVMDETNIRNTKRISTTHPEKIFKLLDFTDQPRDVLDPWYTGNFEDTYNDVLAGCLGLIHHLQKQ